MYNIVYMTLYKCRDVNMIGYVKSFSGPYVFMNVKLYVTYV